MDDLKKSIFYLQQTIRFKKYKESESDLLKALELLSNCIELRECITCFYDDGNLNICQFMKDKSCSPQNHNLWEPKKSKI